MAGSLGAQFILNRGVPGLEYPYDFALLYFIGMACLGVVALAAGRFELTPLAEERSVPFLRYLAEGKRRAALGDDSDPGDRSPGDDEENPFG